MPVPRQDMWPMNVTVKAGKMISDTLMISAEAGSTASQGEPWWVKESSFLMAHGCPLLKKAENH